MSFSLSDTLSDMTKTAAALEKEPAAAAAQQQQLHGGQVSARASPEHTYIPIYTCTGHHHHNPEAHVCGTPNVNMHALTTTITITHTL